MSNTISQCQMLNDPISISLRSDDHGPEHVGAADHVDMKMIHLLPTHSSGVDDRPEAVSRALLPRDPAGEREQAAEQRRLGKLGVVQRGNVQFRDEQHVNGGNRADVVEAQDLVVFVRPSRRDLAARRSCRTGSSRACWRLPFESLLRRARGLLVDARDALAPRSSASTSPGLRPWQASSTRQWNQRSAISRDDRAADRPSFAGHHRLGGLFADLLQDRVVALARAGARRRSSRDRRPCAPRSLRPGASSMSLASSSP